MANDILIVYLRRRRVNKHLTQIRESGRWEVPTIRVGRQALFSDFTIDQKECGNYLIVIESGIIKG